MRVVSSTMKLILSSLLFTSVYSLSQTTTTRRGLFQNLASASLIAISSGRPSVSHADEQAAAATSDKLNLTDEQLKQIIKSDLLDKQFLATGDITSYIYKPTATFTDEIDTYSKEQWIKGTQKLFVGEKSQVRLIGDIDVTPEKVEFRFDEDLMFRIPFRPTVSLSGKLVLTRDESGYITSYREYWDQDVATVLKTARF